MDGVAVEDFKIWSEEDGVLLFLFLLRVFLSAEFKGNGYALFSVWDRVRSCFSKLWRFVD